MCKKNSSLNFMFLVGFIASKIHYFFLKIYWIASLLFSGRNNDLKSHVFWIFQYNFIWSRRINRESWLVRFSVRRHSKKPNIKSTIFSLLLRCHYGFTNYFESFPFSTKNSFNMLNYLSRISTSRNINLTSKNPKIQFFRLFGWVFFK